MAGVVRKKSRMKRMQLMMKQRIHQEIPPNDRCSLWDKGYAVVTLTLNKDSHLWTPTISVLIYVHILHIYLDAIFIAK